MKKLDKSGMFSMLRNPDAITSISQADDVLSKFANELHDYCRREKNLAERYRTLMFTRSFLASPHGWMRGEEKIMRLLSYISGVAVNVIDGELELLKMELEHPERFVKKILPPLAIWNGTIADLLELLTTVQLTGKLLKPSQEPMTYADVISFIRDVFGIHVAQPYKRKTELLTRVKGGAPFLEKLIVIYLNKVKDIYK